jgi:hypothetical protein
LVGACHSAAPNDQPRSEAPALAQPATSSAVMPAVDTAQAVTGQARVMLPPADVVAKFHLSPFYRKYLDVSGLPLVGGERVSAFAMLEAEYLILKMIGDRPELLRAMAANHVRFVVMAKTEMTTDIPEHSDLTPKAFWNRRARGLGATSERPAVSAAEENLLDLPGDPYRAENILIHEFAHTIHERGLVTIDPTFDGRLTAAYEHARKNGLWQGTYASENRMEYWAEAAQSWFDCNRVNDSQHGPIDTREKLKPYDPDVAALLTEVFGDKPWRYTKPSKRPPAERAHLDGFDVAAAGTFVWPDSAPPIAAAGALLPWLAPSQIPSKSPSSNTATSITFDNRRSTDVTIAWVAFDGQQKPYGTIRPGRTSVQQTFAGHVWILLDGQRKLGGVVAKDNPGRAEIH